MAKHDSCNICMTVHHCEPYNILSSSSSQIAGDSRGNNELWIKMNNGNVQLNKTLIIIRSV